MFEIQNIDKNYQQGDSNISVLRGLSLSVKKENCVDHRAIRFRKSTFIDIVWIENIDSGNFFLKDKPVIIHLMSGQILGQLSRNCLSTFSSCSSFDCA